MNIRLIQHHDQEIISRIVEIEKEAFQSGGLNEWSLVPFIRHGKVFALYEDDDLIGSAQFLRDWADFGNAYLYGVSIDVHKRGHGLGTSFLQNCLQQLREDGITAVELTVRADNQAALRIYRDKLGFQIVGERIDEYGDGEDRLVMKCEL